ncbi:sugar transferase [Enterococcus sp. ZJ1668]|uniref:sugar transferase n=1 Tax=Enterococcus sp. ZJ1668 TaxID=2709402 RepID=UPI0013EC6A80|nr:sugar transferase [Enterococcus sp. ZJ1668]
MDKNAINIVYLGSEKRLFDWIWRYFDIVGALAALILSGPLFLLIALLIKLEDPAGPIIFSQPRVGKNGQIFKIYKFRSMAVDAEKRLAELKHRNEMDGRMFKIKDDPRITKTGKWLRKTSLDEFPQFWNILKGEMSFVGPRPPLVTEYDQYTAVEKQRLAVRPGCTGLWQVSGRNSLNFDEMVSLDLEYIQRRSLLLNIKIILLTFREFSNKGNGM